MNLQAKFTETRAALVSAVRVISKLEADNAKLLAENQSSQHFFDVVCVQRDKYRAALQNILAVLGPAPVNGCCEGAKAEMEIAIETAKEALRT